MEPKRTELKEAETVELRPDGWERFERAVDAALRTPPIHRTKETKPKPSVVKEKW